MKKSVVRLGAVAALAVAALAPSAAFADDFGYYEVNYGNGICATVSCGAYGCSVIDYHYCPNEVGGG